MSFAIVPQELIYEIVEQARSRKNARIRSLSLVARRFVVPSQRHLFGRISLSRESDDRKLHAILTESAHLVGYVHQLEIHVAEFQSSEPIAVLDTLTNLNSLTISASRPNRLLWAQIPPAVRASICHAIRLPRTRAFSVQSIDRFPRCVLNHAVLAFSRISLLDVRTLDDAAEPSLKAFETLPLVNRVSQLVIFDRAHRTSDPIYTFLRQQDIQRAMSRINKTSITWSVAGKAFFERAVFRANLVEVCLQWRFINKHTPNPLSLPSLPALRNLTVEMSAHGRWAAALDFTGASITLAESTPALETLDFNWKGWLPSSSEDDAPQAIPFFQNHDYAERLPRLRRIGCTIIFFETNSKLKLDVPTAYVGAVFPGPLADGILSCKIRSLFKIQSA